MSRKAVRPVPPTHLEFPGGVRRRKMAVNEAGEDGSCFVKGARAKMGGK